jgi:hypothetical protein
LSRSTIDTYIPRQTDDGVRQSTEVVLLLHFIEIIVSLRGRLTFGMITSQSNAFTVFKEPHVSKTKSCLKIEVSPSDSTEHLCKLLHGRVNGCHFQCWRWYFLGLHKISYSLIYWWMKQFNGAEVATLSEDLLRCIHNSTLLEQEALQLFIQTIQCNINNWNVINIILIAVLKTIREWTSQEQKCQQIIY